MPDTTVLTVVGARPQFVKAAPVSRALAAVGLREVLVHTGQHHDREMSDVFFDELGIPAPTHNLGVHGGGHGAMTGRMLAGLEELILRESPAAVVVYGDTNSTLAGGLAAAKLHVPVAHVEAGLRSFNRRMPEEVNRVLTDHLSSLLLAPTGAAVRNLAAEGLTQGVHHVGDVMFDATVAARERAQERSDVLERLGLVASGYAVATVHRADNTASALALGAVLDFLREEASRHPVVLPLHPRTRGAVAEFGLRLDGILVVDPLPYLDMVRLTASAALVLTDSGGLQKEAYFHRVPCVTLRGETEWVETVEAGWNRLWREPDGGVTRRDIPEYGTGTSAVQVAELVRELAADGAQAGYPRVPSA